MSDEDPVVDAEIVEDSAVPPVPPGDYTDGGVPTFDYVRDRIEGRFGTSIGAAELAGDAELDEKLAERDRAGRETLEQIRRSMRGE